MSVHENIIIPGDLSGDQTETNMADWRPIGDFDMPHQRPTCPIKTNMPVETHRSPACLRSLTFTYIFIHFAYFYRNNLRTVISYVGLWIGMYVVLWSGMLVFNKAYRFPTKHVGLRSGMSVSDQECRSLIRHASLQWVSDEACLGL